MSYLMENIELLVIPEKESDAHKCYCTQIEDIGRWNHNLQQSFTQQTHWIDSKVSIMCKKIKIFQRRLWENDP